MRHHFKNMFYLTFIIALFISNNVAIAKDLGVIGEIYTIQEEDLLTFIARRIESMQKNGEWKTLENKFRENVANHADRPIRVSLITKAQQNKSWHYDPSIIIPYDLSDANGKVFAQAGTLVNPLKFIKIHKPLIFFDGDDDEQVEWVRQVIKKISGKPKLILVNGSIKNQVKQFKQPIYFDQHGKLSSKFQIRHVPAMVTQDGLNLEIKEIVL